MSDYLTRLIERSLGVAPRIEPLIAPLHSPPGQITGEGADTPPPHGSGSTAKIESLEREATRDDSRKKWSDRATLTRTENQLHRASILLPESQTHPIEKKVDRLEVKSDIPLAPASSVSPPHAVNTTSLPASLPPSATASPRRIQNTIQPETLADLNVTALPKGPPPVLRIAALASQKKSPNVVHPEIKPAAFPSIPLPSSSEPPAIHVTIGRVEVRAIIAPTAPPKVAAPPTSKISLEDYLKQRNGGRS